ncbi:hypothetical protein GCM10017044_18060 [Kordiimonas sediminis]|uniref:HTH araC/xylS-type domain-containing protein n=2 Tax=Kordiimonas sediminis TaxID=1735581 RepID=A0A919AT16_9PROT|nr:hypothetical protein GCM10017044_18060 [Kordiimonas sediminis]
MLIQAIIYSCVTLTFVWWALVTPDTYLQSSQSEQSTSPKPSDFDREVFSRLENIFGTEKPYLDATVNLETLAHQIAVTPRELSNAVNRCTNDGFRAFLRKKRVGHAQELLTNKTCQDLSIYDIAIASGFGTKSTFNESFKLYTGMPPSEFRRQFKEAT